MWLGIFWWILIGLWAWIVNVFFIVHQIVLIPKILFATVVVIYSYCHHSRCERPFKKCCMCTQTQFRTRVHHHGPRFNWIQSHLVSCAQKTQRRHRVCRVDKETHFPPLLIQPEATLPVTVVETVRTWSRSASQQACGLFEGSVLLTGPFFVAQFILEIHHFAWANRNPIFSQSLWPVIFYSYLVVRISHFVLPMSETSLSKGRKVVPPGEERRVTAA